MNEIGEYRDACELQPVYDVFLFFFFNLATWSEDHPTSRDDVHLSLYMICIAESTFTMTADKKEKRCRS